MSFDEVEARASALAGESAGEVRRLSKLVSRSTPEQVRDRMASHALEDEGYREQLLALASTRGGIYQQALEEMNRRA